MSTPVQILGLSEDAVVTSQAGDAITSIVVELSADPDEDWRAAFHHEWALTSYPRKRNARIGQVRAEYTGEVHRGIVFSSTPQDYVDKHKRHLEDAVARANERVQQRARLRDGTIMDAARAIREINRDHYGDDASGLRLAV